MTDKMREVWDAHDEARNKAWREEPGTFDTLDAFKAGAAWQAAQSVPPKPDYSVTQLQRMKSLMGKLGLATDESLEAFCLDADRQLSRAITAMEKFMAMQSVPVVGEVVNWEAFPSYLLDHQEGAMVTEENIQFWLAAMIKDPQYNKPTHSISAAELERMKHCRALLKEARADVVETLNCMRASYRDSPRNKTRLDKQCELLKQIDAAIAAEGEKE